MTSYARAQILTQIGLIEKRVKARIPASRFPAGSFCFISTLISSIPHSVLLPLQRYWEYHLLVGLLPGIYPFLEKIDRASFAQLSRPLTLSSPFIVPTSPSTQQCLPPTTLFPSAAASSLQSQVSFLRYPQSHSLLMATPYRISTILLQPSPQPQCYRKRFKFH